MKNYNSKKKTICVLTATRAEYGLLKPLIAKLMTIEAFDVRIAVTGMHLSEDFGLTYKEIEEDGFRIDTKIHILSEKDSPSAISKSMGMALIEFGTYFEQLNPDMLIVLGDRYETLAVCCAAMNANIPIAHLYGGETTEGAIDESIRHAITKMSFLHFTSTTAYKKRVIQLGESPDRVFDVGALGVENILNTDLLSKEALLKDLGIVTDKPIILVTYHPVTLEKESAREQFYNLLEAFDRRKEYYYILTKANADADGRVINYMIDEYASSRDYVSAYSSLGMLRYLSTLKYSLMVIGNSSSGLIEAPSFKIPTINIGNRQKGRLQGGTVINCEPNTDSILKAMQFATSKDFLKGMKDTVNPYGDGNTSDKIINTLKLYLLEKEIDLKKKFYDIEF